MTGSVGRLARMDRELTEKRQSLRMRRLKEASVFFLDGRTVITCKVRDVSASGARLRVGESFLIPQNFLVTIPGEMIQRPAERVWVRGDEVGIRFKA
ncbi:MAG TPA: PilZ domain-containing protein [Nordella sp.]|nr:PilZ domain-containing protein [Nordella sp.]